MIVWHLVFVCLSQIGIAELEECERKQACARVERRRRRSQDGSTNGADETHLGPLSLRGVGIGGSSAGSGGVEDYDMLEEEQVVTVMDLRR